MEHGSENVEYATNTVSIFPNGFVLTSPRKLKLGSALSLKLRLPPESPGCPFRESGCMGCVMAEQKLEDGTLGYRVEIEAALPA